MLDYDEMIDWLECQCLDRSRCSIHSNISLMCEACQIGMVLHFHKRLLQDDYPDLKVVYRDEPSTTYRCP